MIKELDFSAFEFVVKNPKNQLNKYIGQGKKVIGCFPLYTPEQLVYAAGMIPFGMWGTEMEVNLAKKYFPAYFCGIIQTNLELAMLGAYKGISGVMITLLCDTLKCSSQNWKYAVPEIEMIPVVHPQNRNSKGAYPFLYAQYEKIKDKLERISGNVISEESIAEAIEVYNEHNMLMREFIKLAGMYPAEITPKNRIYVIKSGYFMDKKEHSKLLRELIDDIKTLVPSRFRGIKVVTGGIIADSENLLDILSENRIAIAADEVAHESRQFRNDVEYNGDGIGSLVNQYLDFYGCSTVIGGQKHREDYLLELVRETGAEGVIVFMTKFCDPEEYDYPLIKEKLEKAGIPLLSIELDKQTKNYGQAATALQTFKEMIYL